VTRFLFKFSAWGSAFADEAYENALSPSQTNSAAIYSFQPSARDCKLVSVKINLDVHFSELGLVDCFQVAHRSWSQ